MKKTKILATLLLSASVVMAFDFNSLTKSVTDSLSGDKSKTSSTTSILDNETVTSGLKEALKSRCKLCCKRAGFSKWILK